MYAKTSLPFFKENVSYRGRLYIVSGPSGVGKTTIIESLLSKDNHLEKIVAYTTRERRAHEEADRTYHYISREAFRDKIKNNDFLEYMEFSDQLYGFGLSKQEVLAKLKQGIDLIVDLDYSQILDLKSKIPNCYSIFIVPPSLESLKIRLISRGENGEIIAKRMTYAKDIIEHQQLGDRIIVNQDGKIEEAVEEVLELIHEYRVSNQHTTEKFASEILSTKTL
ncbi:guanylate kinase [Legionella sp. D16C41]|uniref:guanylate kinase n=1 Tax=Legionella sp. D16C41 TaxID=3402688 RepID=UPI003AF786D1